MGADKVSVLSLLFRSPVGPNSGRSPSRRTISSDHVFSPNGHPRLTERRKAANSASVSTPFTSDNQRRGRSNGQSANHDLSTAFGILRRYKLDQRHCSARSTRFALKVLRSTYRQAMKKCSSPGLEMT